MKGHSIFPSESMWEGWNGREQELFADASLGWGRNFGAEKQWQMSQVSEVCRFERIITSGRTDADFIWIKVSVWYLQPPNTVEFLKKVNKIYCYDWSWQSWPLWDHVSVVHFKASPLEMIPKKPYSNIFSSLPKVTIPLIYQL